METNEIGVLGLKYSSMLGEFGSTLAAPVSMGQSLIGLGFCV